jgi:murein DD-endopeptidase MepM/ murein hydrolase activator NlpD
MHIKRGDLVGYVGVSGRTTGPHVHYEVRMNGAPVNPMRYLRSSSSAD